MVSSRSSLPSLLREAILASPLTIVTLPGATISLAVTTFGPYVKSLLADKEKLSAAWLDKKASLGEVTRLPARSDITEAINEQLIVEFYSR